jgi:hypothetical protein
LIGFDIFKPNNMTANDENNNLTYWSYSIPILTVTAGKTQLIHLNCSINLSPFSTEVIWIKLVYMLIPVVERKVPL